MTFISRWFGRLVIAVVAVSAFVLPLESVRAHAQLDRTSPAASSVVPNSPQQILLDFSEPVETGLSKIRLFGRNDIEISLGTVEHDVNDKSIIFASAPALDAGPYAVVWNTTSADGHSLNGAFTFEVGNQSTGESAELLETVITTINNESPLEPFINVFRYFSFLAIVTIIGLVVLLGAGDLMRETRLLAVLSATLAMLFVSTLGLLFLQGPYAAQRSWGAIGDFDLLNSVLDTRMGLALLLRLLTTVVGFALLLGVLRNWHHSTLWPNIAVFNGIGLVLSFGLAGHPSTASPALLAVIVDSIHMWSLSVWIGGVIVLAVAWKMLVRADAVVNDIHVVNRFSRLATYAMPMTVVSGLISAVIITGGLSSIFDHRYGSILRTKIILVAVAVVIGAAARRALRKTGAFSIRRAILLEATLGLVVFALSVGLVVTPPDGIDTSATSVHTATLVQDDVVVDLTLSPTRVGPVEVHVILSPPGGSLDPMQEVVVTLTPRDDAGAALPVDVIQVGPNHWSGFAEVSVGGQWEMTVDATRQNGDLLKYATMVQISSR
jgi:copper transport protein